jgi:hypothetical protein
MVSQADDHNVGLVENKYSKFETTASQKRAREIMGCNFFGVEEAIKHFGVNPTRQQLDTLSEVPFSEKVLLQSSNTHVLVAVLPLSILDVRSRVEDKGLFYNQNWDDKEPFAKKRGDVSCQLVRKTPVDDSPLKDWQEQQALISKDDKVPTAQVMIYTIFGHYLATRERLFEHTYVRTSSVYPGGYHISVGGFASKGLGVGLMWDDGRGAVLGVSSARTFD